MTRLSTIVAHPDPVFPYSTQRAKGYSAGRLDPWPYILVVMLLAGTIYKAPLAHIGGATLEAFDFVAFLATLFTVMRASVRSPHVRILPVAITVTALLFLSTRAMSLLAAGPFLAESVRRLGHIALTFGLLPAFFLTFRTVQQVRRCLLLVALATALLSLVSVTWFLMADPRTQFMAARGYLRFASSDNTGTADIDIALPFFKIIGFLAGLTYWLSQPSKTRSLKYALLPPVTFAGLLATLSRGALITAVIGSIVIVINTYRTVPRTYALLALVAGAGLLFNITDTDRTEWYKSILVGPDRQVTLDARNDFWRASYEITKRSPLFGVGLGNYDKYFIAYLPLALPKRFSRPLSAHSDFFDSLAETGTVGTAAYLLLMMAFLVISHRLKNRSCTTDPTLASGLHAIVVTFVLSGFYANGFPSWEPFFALALLSACGGTARTILTGQRYERNPRPVLPGTKMRVLTC